MLYLLDASVLITANAQYYPVDRIPEYWEWLQHMGEEGYVKLPIEIFEEIKDGPKEKDLLFDWLQEEATKKAILLSDVVSPETVQKVVSEGYANDLSDDEIEQLGRDPFLIAHGLSGKDRCVVTVEISQPRKQRQNRKVPDVCRSMGVKCCDPFAFTRELGFSTDWKKKLGGRTPA